MAGNVNGCGSICAEYSGVCVRLWCYVMLCVSHRAYHTYTHKQTYVQYILIIYTHNLVFCNTANIFLILLSIFDSFSGVCTIFVAKLLFPGGFSCTEQHVPHCFVVCSPRLKVNHTRQTTRWVKVMKSQMRRDLCGGNTMAFREVWINKTGKWILVKKANTLNVCLLKAFILSCQIKILIITCSMS